MSNQTEQNIQTLVDFMKSKKKQACPVCGLSAEVREQLNQAREKGIRRRDQREWLRTVVGAEIADADLNAHYSGRHDDA